MPVEQKVGRLEVAVHHVAAGDRLVSGKGSDGDPEGGGGGGERGRE